MSAMRKRRGFTVVEMLMTVTLLAVLVALGAPNLRNLMISQKVKTAASDLHLSLSLARSEAIKRNAAVDIVPVSTADWSQGWSVKAGTSVLMTQDPYKNVAFTGPAANVTYVGTGRMTGTAVLFFIHSTDAPAIAARCVQIEPSGRPSVRVDGDGNSADGVCG